MNIYTNDIYDHVGTLKMDGKRKIIRWHRKNELKV